MTGERVCQEHGQNAVSSCNWCSKPICEKCITEAENHKLCSSCAMKLSHEKPLVKRRRAGDVRNIDHSLTDEQIIAARKYLFPEEAKKGPKIKNVPDTWPKIRG